MITYVLATNVLKTPEVKNNSKYCVRSNCTENDLITLLKKHLYIHPYPTKC